MLDHFFKLKERKTSIRTELLAGVTTFSAMMYILIVNPIILSQGGMDQEAVLAATIYASALMTLSMGLFTNLPLALAPGMGLNAFFTYTLCLSKNIPWQAALGIVFYSGILFFILTLSGFRRKIFELIPVAIRHGLTVGIGLFITLIGLKNAQIVVPNQATLISLGNMKDPGTILVLLGIILAAFLIKRKISSSLLISMVFISLGFILLGQIAAPISFLSPPPSISASFFKLDLVYFWQNLGTCLPLVLTLFVVDLFDNMGTLLAVTTRAKLETNLDRALKADAFAAILGAILGTSSVTSYIESATGVEEGGRSGLTSVSVALCFLLSLFLSPLFLAIPIAATTPALVMVGFFMMSEIKEIQFDEIESALPAFITIIMIPFSFSIAEGLGLGLATYACLRLWKKR
jgi:AGZA family xanthine/uracil permease-like MFS transporter